MLAGAFGSSTLMPRYLRGEVTTGNSLVPVQYNNWTLNAETGSADGARKFNEAILRTEGDVVGFGHSLGAVSIGRWLHDYGPRAGQDLVDRLSIVLIGNSRRRYGGLLTAWGWNENCAVPVDTPFKVVDLARQYDGWADWPSDNRNRAAVDTALAGQRTVHVAGYKDASIYDAENLKFVEGNVTFLLSPNPSPLPEVEAGYNRPES